MTFGPGRRGESLRHCKARADHRYQTSGWSPQSAPFVDLLDLEFMKLYSGSQVDWMGRFTSSRQNLERDIQASAKVCRKPDRRKGLVEYDFVDQFFRNRYTSCPDRRYPGSLPRSKNGSGCLGVCKGFDPHMSMTCGLSRTLRIPYPSVGNVEPLGRAAVIPQHSTTVFSGEMPLA
jgi:hypothetical protein